MSFQVRVHCCTAVSGELFIHSFIDLIWCYKVVFGLVDIDMNAFFKLNTRATSRGHPYKLYKERAVTSTRSHFFSERVTNVWNSLPTEFDFSSLKRFRRAIVNVDFSAFTKHFSHCINV